MRQLRGLVARHRGAMKILRCRAWLPFLLLASTVGLHDASAAWVVEVADPAVAQAGGVAHEVSLAIGSDGAPHISYYDGTLHLRYATKQGGGG
jgi:hypothetical protein